MITKENPKRLAPQNCPLCNEPQDVIVNGHYPLTAEIGGDIGFDKDRGYSFCNCRNIWFTNWEHMNQLVYDQDYVKRYDSQHMSDILRNYHTQYLQEVARHKPNGSFMEIGCINPALLNAFRASGYKTTALDMMKHDVGENDFIEGNFETIPFTPAAKFDVIWASHVFEHFKDPIGAAAKCNELLTPGGLLFIAMPDPFFIDFKDIKTWQHFHLNEHHIMWDMDSFAEVIEENGFEIVFKKHNTSYEFICIGDFHIMAKKK